MVNLSLFSLSLVSGIRYDLVPLLLRHKLQNVAALRVRRAPKQVADGRHRRIVLQEHILVFLVDNRCATPVRRSLHALGDAGKVQRANRARRAFQAVNQYAIVLPVPGCAGFPQLAIWANAKGPYVCLEPWYGRTDDAGFAGTLAQKPGVQILDSGETQEISYEIEFHSECD